MKYIIEDQKYRFKFAFDTKTGAYVRTGILDENGKDTGVDPFMASYPHLIDVGIMGHCIHGQTGLCAKAGIGCYQSGMFVQQPNMTLSDFESIAEQSSGRCNQFALGGRGDPDQHEHFEDILKICHQYNLVPNFYNIRLWNSRFIQLSNQCHSFNINMYGCFFWSRVKSCFSLQYESLLFY